MDECLPYYISLTEGHGSGANCAMRSEALLLRGDDTSAEALCHKAIYLASAQAQDSICFAAELTLLRIALLRGDITSDEGYSDEFTYPDSNVRPSFCVLTPDPLRYEQMSCRND